MQPAQQLNIKVQQWVVAASIVLFILKIAAYYLTNSVAVLTDALESTVNLVTGFTGLYALRVAARPRDENHPYGHGKAELVSASLEGILIVVAGLIIIYESLINLQHAHPVENLDSGVLIVGFAAAVNYALGAWCIRVGQRNHSIALQASGKHLQSDTWTTVGIIAGLLLLRFTGITWIDSATALIFAIWIILEGISILRDTIKGIMDESDMALVEQLIALLNEKRHNTWIDIHNLRTLKFGNTLHVDCHLTVPWYYQIQKAHDEAAALEQLIDQSFDHHIEIFVHLDACVAPRSCQICPIQDCPVRQHAFEKRLAWTMTNVTENSRHGIKE
jgi:cation diffusion facilitator family transporter